ncbi:MAG: FAD-dependent oxidoreductase [Pyrinomonadaceae bacterium]
MNTETPNAQNSEIPLHTLHSALCTKYDVIVIGAGAAGLSAGLWCDELGLNTLLLEEQAEIGGQLLWIYNTIENHLGAETAVNGSELRDKFASQINKRGFAIRTEAKVSAIDFKTALEKRVVLENGEQLSADFLILASGVRRRKLNVPGEDKFKGRGWLESGKRDINLVAGKIVCIIGGGDAAAENALMLAKVAKKVYLVHRRDEFRARPEFLEKISNNSRIETLTQTRVLQITGDERIEAVKLQKDNLPEPFQIAVDAVLLRIGVEPNSELFRSVLETDAGGYIEIDNYCETSVKGVFAVGDVANPLAPTISSAVGMGATAAKVIAGRIFLQKREQK